MKTALPQQTWTVDDGLLCQQDHIDRLTEDLDSPERHWVAVGIEDEDGYAESVAYCHPSNAPLIAAAPELLDALQNLLAHPNWPGAKLTARNAIKKATV